MMASHRARVQYHAHRDCHPREEIMSRSLNRAVGRHMLACFIALCFAMSSAYGLAGDAQAFRDLLEMSLKEKKGLTFYVNGHIIAGAVTRLIGEDAVELKNREFGRIIIRLDRVDAVAAN
jgi:hypothetical protein